MKTAVEIDEIAAWLAASDLARLELRMPGGTVRLGRDPAAPQRVVRLHLVEADSVTLTAPSVGEFLHRHPLHREAMTSIGSHVVQGQPLGLLAIGPLLLRVDAPRSGVITAVLAAQGARVGFGAPLFALQPD